MELALIAAVADNGVIGKANQLPWHLPRDLRHFMDTTMGKPVIMGRKTWDSLPQALPDRANIVVSRRAGLRAPGARVVADLDAAVAVARHHAWRDRVGEVLVVGGADIYRMAFPLARRFYLTEVHAEVAGDVHFPPWPKAEWREVSRRRHAADAANPLDCSFVEYERVAEFAHGNA